MNRIDPPPPPQHKRLARANIAAPESRPQPERPERSFAGIPVSPGIAIGPLFGFVRWRTGTTTLVILMHVLLNLESVVETEFVLG